MNCVKRNVVIGLCLLSLLALGVPCCAAESETDLLATLKSSEASDVEKTAACKRLAVVGTEAAIPVLVGLLDDEKFSHYARYGLEPIPSNQVDEVLIAALSKLKGRHLIGVIQSLGNRGKSSAIEVVATKLDDSDREVAKAAAHCLGRLGTPAAANILSDRLSEEFAPACLVCAKQLVRQGNNLAAIELFQKISRQEDAADFVRQAAMLHMIEMQGSAELLGEALSSEDQALENMGLRTARLIDPSVASEVAREVLKDAKPRKAALLLTLLGDLGDAASLPSVAEAAQSSDVGVRKAAIEALARLGGPKQVALLLAAAADESSLVASAAMETLVTLPGDEIDQVILELFKDKQRQGTAIRVIGRRRIAAAVPMLVELLGGPDELGAIAALGETVSLDELDLLGNRLESESPELREAVRKAFHAACYRMPNRSATVAKLTGYLDRASDEIVPIVMEELRQIGGPEALAVVAESVNSNDPTQREFSTRVLGGWLDTSAADVLLKLAQDEGKTKFGIRGIRGYIRLARQFSMPDAERVTMCRQALETAKRTEDKLLVLKVLERYSSIATLEVAVEAATDPNLQQAASTTAKIVARKVKGQEAAVEALLAKLPKQ